MDEEAVIAVKLDELARVSALYDSIQVVDAGTWKGREKVGEVYLEISDWLWEHGIFPQYDHEQKRFIGHRRSVGEESEQEETNQHDSQKQSRTPVCFTRTGVRTNPLLEKHRGCLLLAFLCLLTGFVCGGLVCELVGATTGEQEHGC